MIQKTETMPDEPADAPVDTPVDTSVDAAEETPIDSAERAEADQPSNAPARQTWIKVATTAVACTLLVGVAIAAVYLIEATAPVAEREAATRKSAALVEVTTAERSTYNPRLEVLGVVEPAREITLSPRVSGEVVELQDAFVPGGLVEAGQPLLKLDPVDYEQLLLASQSQLDQALAELAIEEGRQNIARSEFEVLGTDLETDDPSLVLREPQIRSIRAQVDAARAALRQAELSIERTTVAAPFDAQILQRNTNLGAQVTPGDTLAQLVGTEEYWIRANVPLRDLRWINFEDGSGEASKAVVRLPSAWGLDGRRDGNVTRLIGNVDAQSRLARVLITVPDPLARETQGPALILGTLVRIEIEGREIPDVVRLDRAYLRAGNTVWIMTPDNKLEIREVEVAFTDAGYAYISAGLEPGERVVTTSLATVTDGLELRQAEPVEATNDVEEEEEEAAQ